MQLYQSPQNEIGRNAMKPLKLGHIHLKVRNLQRSIDFYTEIFGLKLEERVGQFAFLSDFYVHHAIALQALGDSAPLPHPGSTGLYHTAFEVQSENEFWDKEQQLRNLGLEVITIDHGISWAIYFEDPDENGLEIYFDRRHILEDKSRWSGRSRRLSRPNG